jgi:hypothetical protein
MLPGSPVFFSTQDHNGHTTEDFLPATGTDFPAAERTARTPLALLPGKPMFFVMLGTNDSAQSGPPRRAGGSQTIHE